MILIFQALLNLLNVITNDNRSDLLTKYYFISFHLQMLIQNYLIFLFISSIRTINLSATSGQKILNIHCLLQYKYRFLNNILNIILKINGNAKEVEQNQFSL
ncbi:hypothetical protein pb186bvf_015930 [Paramecium bursaria]